MPRPATPTLDPKNARVHDDRSKQAIRQSLEKLGTGRSILLDSEDVIVAGNGVHEQAEALGIPVRVIESDGTELIAIRRTDLATEDERRRALAIADNRTGELSFFDSDVLAELVEGLDDEAVILATGFTDEELAALAPSEGLLGDLEDGDFGAFVEGEKDTFAVTLSFALEHRERMRDYIRQNGKEGLTALILQTVLGGDADA